MKYCLLYPPCRSIFMFCLLLTQFITYGLSWSAGLSDISGCSLNFECGFGYYCAKPYGLCGGSGVCQVIPEVCLTYVDPVCGCDGWTYSNNCEAAAHGVSIAYNGSCGVPRYTLSTTITGNGTVNSGDGIACTGPSQQGNCAKDYPYGAKVSLMATVSNSLFSGWSGDCVSCGSNLACPVIVNSTKACSSAFVDPAQVIIIGSSQTFSLLQSAYTAAGNGAIIKAQGVSFGEDLLLDVPGRAVTIKGGYEPTFTSQSGYSTVKTLVIGRGGLVADRVTIR